MKTFRFLALITLGPAEYYSLGRDYRSGTRAVMVGARALNQPARREYHHPHRRRSREFFAPGQHFTLWNGHDIGTGVVSRQVFTSGSPS